MYTFYYRTNLRVAIYFLLAKLYRAQPSIESAEHIKLETLYYISSTVGSYLIVHCNQAIHQADLKNHETF